MDRHAGGLVENNEVAVLIDNRKRQIDGNEIFVWFDVREWLHAGFDLRAVFGWNEWKCRPAAVRFVDIWFE